MGLLRISESVRAYVYLTLLAPGFLGWCSTRGGGLFSTPSVIPLSLKLDYSNFVQNYFEMR